jgi:uncharacterized membrane protein
MGQLIRAACRRAGRYFLAGVFALLPLIITVAVIVWVGGYLAGILGPDSILGGVIRRLGLHFASDATLAYLIGALLVLALVFVVGVLVEAGARTLFQRVTEGVLGRIPLVGSVYGTSKQMVAMLEKKEDANLKGMRVVFCMFGAGDGAAFLALLVSPERFRIRERDYQIVIVPTAPVPIGGGLLFVPAEAIQPTELSVDGLMSIYVSMGVTAPQYLPPIAGRPQ